MFKSVFSKSLAGEHMCHKNKDPFSLKAVVPGVEISIIKMRWNCRETFLSL